MRKSGRAGRGRVAKAERQAAPGYWRDRLAVLLAILTVVCLGAAFLVAKDVWFLMPGPLASAHSAIENCGACHTKSGTGKFSWMHGLVAGDPGADSEACLACHKMPDTAFNAHGASEEALKRSSMRLAKIAEEIPAPGWARAQGIVFPTHDMITRGLYCATCHKEHRGSDFKLSKAANEQCQSCHVVKFDSFDGHHPEFESYPFKRRTAIIYDHVAHGRHFADVAKEDPTRRIPAACSACHDSRKDRRVMAVASFEQTCSGCHLGQITGKDRASGPKGIAFLTVPGLDLTTLRKRNAPIGEWPAASEAELTPFMKVMISRSERGRALIDAVDRLNLQDLSDASDDQIKAVVDLTWEIKRLFYAMISGKASDILANLNLACGAKLSAALVADLTASIPRDVLVSAQQQWLPNLGSEMANRKFPNDQEPTCWITTITKSSEVAGRARLPGRTARADQTEEGNAGTKNWTIDPRGRLLKGEEEKSDAAIAKAGKDEVAQPRGTAGQADAASAKAANASAKVAKQTPPPVVDPPRTKGADQTDDLLNLTDEELLELDAPGKHVENVFEPKETARTADTANAKAGKKMPAGGELPRPKEKVRTAQAPDERPRPKGADQTDDLLNPTPEELAATDSGDEKAPRPGALEPKAPEAKAPEAKAPPPKAPPPKTDAANVKADRVVPTASEVEKAAPPPKAPPKAEAGKTDTPPVISIKSDVDPESWAEYGGWYRQDYAILYRPTGHKDKFMYSWLFLSGPQAPKGDRSPAAAVFDLLTGKDAQGACTKCHSVDSIRGEGRMVNFSPPSVRSKQGRFTRFIHEPHFGALGNRGCLTCHSLEKGHAYLESYVQGDPRIFVSNFGAVRKELCQSCHTSGKTRQDCLLCHKYHVNDVFTPVMSTKLPTD
jgi:doubled CXXCH motif protein